MSLWSDFYTAIVDLSYQERLLKESNLNREAFHETIETAKHKLSLQKNEYIIYHDFTLYAEPRAIREYVRGFSGFRIMKGVYVGGSRGRSESHEELRILDYGTLTITNKRLIFMGKFNGHDIKIDNISFMNVHTDGVQVGKTGRQRTLYFSAESGLLPYFAIKNVAIYKKLENLHQYLKFFRELPEEIEKLNVEGKHDNEFLKSHSTLIENVVNDIEIKYKNFRTSDFSLLNKNIEELIINIKSLTRTISFILEKAEEIEKTVEKPKGMSKIFKSSSKQILNKFKEKYGNTPEELTLIESDKLNKTLSNMGSEIEQQSKLFFDKIDINVS